MAAWEVHSAADSLEEIIRGRGTQFDPTVVDLFERVLDAEPAAA